MFLYVPGDIIVVILNILTGDVRARGRVGTTARCTRKTHIPGREYERPGPEENPYLVRMVVVTRRGSTRAVTVNDGSRVIRINNTKTTDRTV